MHIFHLEEYAVQLDQLNLKEAWEIQGFDPKDLFSAHMSLVGYASYFTKSLQFEGGGDNQNIPEASVENTLNDIKELASTNECYKQRGGEAKNKNLNSPNILQKRTSSKTKPRSSGREQRRSSTGNSNYVGELSIQLTKQLHACRL
jgi:hypothetical protein